VIYPALTPSSYRRARTHTHTHIHTYAHIHTHTHSRTGVAAGTQGTERADLLHSVTDLCDSEGVPRPTFILPALQW